jgi:hypothetical protein
MMNPGHTLPAKPASKLPHAKTGKHDTGQKMSGKGRPTQEQRSWTKETCRYMDRNGEGGGRG